MSATSSSEGSKRSTLPVVRRGRDSSIGALDRPSIHELLLEHGAVRFQGFSPTLEEFRVLTRAFSTRFLMYRQGNFRRQIDDGGEIQTVSLGQARIPLHAELSHTPFPPEVGWLLCRRFECRGGRTFLCDGTAVVDRLPKPLFDRLVRSSLAYVTNWREEDIRAYIGAPAGVDVLSTLAERGIARFYARGREKNLLRQNYTTPAIQIHERTGRRVFANNIIHNSVSGQTLLALLYRAGYRLGVSTSALNRLAMPLRRREGTRAVSYPRWGDGRRIEASVVRQLIDACEPLTAYVDWNEGDVLLWDNRRMMHGREAFEGPRDILTCWGADYVAPG